jgi:hypothetical protein
MNFYPEIEYYNIKIDYIKIDPILIVSNSTDDKKHVDNQIEIQSKYLEIEKNEEIKEILRNIKKLPKNNYQYQDLIKLISFRSYLSSLPSHKEHLKTAKTLDEIKYNIPDKSIYKKEIQEYIEEMKKISDKMPVSCNLSLHFPIMSEFNVTGLKSITISNLLQNSEIQSLFMYREKNINIHANSVDEYLIIELPEMLTGENISLLPQFKKNYKTSPFFLHELQGQLCENLDNIKKIVKVKYNIVFNNTILFEYKYKWDTEYRNMLGNIAILTLLPDILEIKGTLFIDHKDYYLKITNDFLHILTNLFETVNVIKTKLMPISAPYIKIICRGYKRNIECENKINKLYQDWLNIDNSCGMMISQPISQPISGGKNYNNNHNNHHNNQNKQINLAPKKITDDMLLNTRILYNPDDRIPVDYLNYNKLNSSQENYNQVLNNRVLNNQIYNKMVIRLTDQAVDESNLIEILKKDSLLFYDRYKNIVPFDINDTERIKIFMDIAKLEAKYYYSLMKIDIPLNMLYTKNDIHQIFENPVIKKVEVNSRPLKLNKKHEHSILDIDNLEYLYNREYVNYTYLDNIRNRMKTNLFTLKRQIDLMTNEEYYKKMSEIRRISSTLIKNKANQIVEFKISQAFLKMCEILHETDLLKINGEYRDKIDCFHLCEAPGQFILAFNRFCKKRNIKYDWIATSLKGNGGIGDTYNIIKNNPTKWIYGPSNDGDILNPINIRDFVKGKYDIVTSDCGFDQSIFGYQEDVLIKINYCQLVTMLLSLKPMGNCVFKTFLPIYYPINISMFYVMYQCFDKIIYFKPTLNPKSSEIYVLGIGFKKIAEDLQEKLLLNTENFDPNTWIFKDIDVNFANDHFNAVESCINNANKYIVNTMLMYYYFDLEKDYNKLMNIRNKYVDDWIKKYL